MQGDVTISNGQSGAQSTLVNTGTLRKSAGTGSATIAITLNNTGGVDVHAGTLALPGSLNFDGLQLLNIAENAALIVDGGITGNSRNSDSFSPRGTLSLKGGSAAAPRLFEVMGQDLGNVTDGFNRNFAYGTISLGSSSYIRLVDNADNAFAAAPKLLYANTLIVPSGSTLDLNGLHIYTRASQIDGTIVGGTISELPDGGALAFGSSVPGRIGVPGEVDEWTFFGRAGRGAIVRVNPGLGSPAPLNPQLNFARVSVLDPDGNVLASASSTTSGEVVTLPVPSLPEDGTYRIRIQAPVNQPSNTGRYVVVAFDLTIDSAEVVYDQRTSGTLASPYDQDRWTFAAQALQQIGFDLIGTTSSAIQFKLTGPNGWVGFTGLGADMELLTLPLSGAYTLEANADGGDPGSYSFRIKAISQTALNLGIPYTGTLTEDGFAQVFRVEVAQDQPLLIDLDAASDSVHTEVYARRGVPPTRREYDFSAAGPGRRPAAPRDIRCNRNVVGSCELGLDVSLFA